MAQLHDQHSLEGQVAFPVATHPNSLPAVPGYLLLQDVDGLRHAIRVSAIQMLSDGDQCCDTTMAVVAGRSLVIPQPLDDLLEQLTPRSPARRR